MSELLSQPARAVWIEIFAAPTSVWRLLRRHSLRGLCGLKCKYRAVPVTSVGHSLRGLCGLKLLCLLKKSLR